MQTTLNTEKQFISIGELSQITGVSRDTIRYYEKLGLLKQTERAENNYRLFEKETSVAKLYFIKKAQKVDFSLPEIKSILEISASSPCGEVRHLLEQKIETVEQKLQLLKEHLDFLNEVKSKWEKLTKNSSGKELGDLCPLIESL